MIPKAPRSPSLRPQRAGPVLRRHPGDCVSICLKTRGRSASVFSFYNDRVECENRIEEFKNGFAADRLSCHRFRANAFRLLRHSFAHSLVNLFRLQLPSSMRSAQIETLRVQLFKIGARVRETARCVRSSPGQRLAFSRFLPSRLQLLLDCLACSTTHSRKAQGGAISKNGS